MRPIRRQRSRRPRHADLRGCARLPAHGDGSPRRLRRLIPLAAALLLSACASTGGQRAPYAHIVIINDSSSMVTVYALPGGSRVRLGQVRGIGQQEFAIRRRHLDGSGQLQLLIDPLGSPRRYPTDSIMVVEGDVIEFRVSSFIR